MGKVILIVLVVIVAIVVAIQWQGKQYQAFMTKAVKVQGYILLKESRSFRQNQKTVEENWARYKYEVAGKDYAGMEKIEYADIWHDLEKGQAIDVYYNQDNPGDSHLAPVLDRRMKIADKVSETIGN